MATYSRAMKKAPRDHQLLLLVPTGDPQEPIATEIGGWDGKRWEGDWRYDESAGNWAKAGPIAWAEPPEIDVEILMGLAKPAKKDKALIVALKRSIEQLEDPAPVPLPPAALSKRHGVELTTGKPVPKAKPARSSAPSKQISTPAT
jgi:hypothetical protein